MISREKNVNTEDEGVLRRMEIHFPHPLEKLDLHIVSNTYAKSSKPIIMLNQSALEQLVTMHTSNR